MSGGTIGTSLNLGFAGVISRNPYHVITNKTVYSGANNMNFGVPALLIANSTYNNVWVDVLTQTLTATNFAGVVVFNVQQNNTYPVGQDVPLPGFYAPNQPADVLQEGPVTITLGTFSSACYAGGTVYVRTVLNSSYPNSHIGDWECASDSGKNVALTNVKFSMGQVDANNTTEIKLLYSNN